MIRRAGAFAALFAAFALGAVAAAPSAAAHAALRSSEPAAGAQLPAAPGEITITFTEQTEPALSSIRVLDSTGSAYERGKPAPDGGDALTLRVAVESLNEGVYTVLWRVVSRVDGHATAGSFAFGVGVSPAGAPPPPAAAEPETVERSSLEMLGRFLMFAGIVVVIGGAWFALFALREHEPRRDRRLLAYTAAGWVVAVAGVPLLAEAQRRAAGAGFGDLAGTTIGRALVWRGVGVLAAGAGIAVAILARGTARRAALVVAAVAAAAATFVHVQAGHASATANPGAQVASQLVHVVAVSLWVGGFGALLAAIRGASSPDKTRAIKRYSATAGVTLFIVLATGVARSLGELESLGDLTSTGYGRAALIKIAIFAAITALGAVNRFRNVAKAPESLRPLRSVVKVEAALGAAALVAAAILASLAPPSPSSAAGTGRSERLEISASDFATTTRARVTIEPGYAGVNEVTVALADYDTGEPIVGADVSLRFAYLDDTTVPPSSVPLTAAGGKGRYAAQGANLSLDGRWQLTILVQRNGGSTEIPLTVATRCRVTPTPFEGQPTLYDAALAGGRSVQMYAGPAASGKTEIHITLFDAQGTEEFVRSAGVTAAKDGDDPRRLPHRRFTDGHFIATGELGRGSWRFDVTIATPDGTFKACFEETIGG
ncbi:MAG TPA: copper resistance protein CopC [Actinomycetota bacterium]|nr:copper resistance protein CopC [Actinomycetota bacterium]